MAALTLRRRPHFGFTTARAGGIRLTPLPADQPSVSPPSVLFPQRAGTVEVLELDRPIVRSDASAAALEAASPLARGIRELAVDFYH